MKQIRIPARMIEERTSPIVHIQIMPLNDNRMIVTTEDDQQFERVLSEAEFASVLVLVEPAVTAKIADATIEDIVRVEAVEEELARPE